MCKTWFNKCVIKCNAHYIQYQDPQPMFSLMCERLRFTPIQMAGKIVIMWPVSISLTKIN
jgi:hypothetical protein